MSATLEPTVTADVFAQSAKRLFAYLKSTDRYDELFVRGIALADGQGYLVPVCELHAEHEETIENFALWRHQNDFAFPTQFPVTIDGTKNWLRNRLLDADNRLLFLVVDAHGKAVGHLGYVLNGPRGLEVDNVVRGDKTVSPGIMSAAMRALIQWANTQLFPDRIILRVFSDNDRAVGFYRKLDFAIVEETPLRKEVKGDSISYVPTNGVADKTFLVMEYLNSAEPSEKMILTAGPSISAREASYALDAARNGWNGEWSKYIKRFEQTFADYLGVKYVLSTSSCTGALHLSLLALGIGEGDEVIVPDITWVATANAVAYTGATPIFADVQSDSWCIDPDSIEALITPRTKAIMPVHLYGHPAEMDRIQDIARRHGLKIVEDAAPSIGAEFKGQRTGTFGDASGFSFQGAKLLVTGEGGMFCTNDEAIYRTALSLWDQGRDLNRTFWINETGWKYKMSNVQAAIGLGQIERVDELIEAKRRIFSWYAEGLAGTPFVTLAREADWARSIYWMSSMTIDPAAPLSRDGLREAMKADNVDTRPVFPAISQYPIWRREQAPQPNAKRIGDTSINLPSGVCLSKDQVMYTCQVIRKHLSR